MVACVALYRSLYVLHWWMLHIRTTRSSVIVNLVFIHKNSVFGCVASQITIFVFVGFADITFVLGGFADITFGTLTRSKTRFPILTVII